MKPKRPITIVLADDHKIFREGLYKILATQHDFRITGSAQNGQELIEFVRKTQPCVVLTDIKMPLTDGIEATRWIVQHFPKVQVIALTIFSDRELTNKMFEAGASDFILKNAETTEVCSVIRKAAGITSLHPILSKKFMRFFREKIRCPEKRKTAYSKTNRNRAAYLHRIYHA